MPERRVFFERLVQSLHERGETLNAPPQVSKTIVDLHRLYVAVRRRGGFEYVCLKMEKNFFIILFFIGY